jgi:hypothetical protein
MLYGVDGTPLNHRGWSVSTKVLRRVLAGYLLLLLPAAWLATRYDRYAIDGDAVAYMDLADLLHAHRWTDAVNAYWHPLYPAMLWMAQVLFHPTRMTELGAYYTINFLLFVAQVGAMLLFVRALVRLRARISPMIKPLLSQAALQLLGISLMVIATMRELSLGKVRTDGLLQALILLGLAMLMESLAADVFSSAVTYAALMGFFLGLGYLTKSFAFLLALLSIAVLVLFGYFVQRRGPGRSLVQGFVALVVFAIVAGPYMAALSHQKGRFDFGDSGSLNYVWYVSGTEKMHLEPSMTNRFGSATVHLAHPEKQLMASPGVYSYKALANGTYPPWFDATYFNERITPKFSLSRLAHRDARNFVLILRYLLNHPEPLLLLTLLLAAGGVLRGANRFAWPSVVLGLLMWAIYTMVNVEERYVTVAYFAILLPLFAAMQPRHTGDLTQGSPTRVAAILVVLFAFLQLGELYRQDASKRRDELVAGQVPAWRDHDQYGAAEGLARLGIHPGDEVACIGEDACLTDNYWARLARVRVLTEIYEPTDEHLIDVLDAMRNRAAALSMVKAEGAKVLVGGFDPGEMNGTHPAAAGWVRLGETRFYALPMNSGPPGSR